MRWARYVARTGAKRNIFRVLLRNPEGMRLLGKPRGKWNDNLIINRREIG
jgi:hypothetical protein